MNTIITTKQSRMAAKLPYGISNFEWLITEGYAYVDKTRFIELLENESKPYQLFIRPRKFGKSLFFTTLACYYNVNYADKFERLFKGLYIGEHPTPEHKYFLILKFDFSGFNTNSVEDFKASFYDRIREMLLGFVDTQRHLFRNADRPLEQIEKIPQSIGALQTIFSAVRSIGAKLFVIIDEYDHFVNDLTALLDGLFCSWLYIPSREKEVEHGYIDIFLQRNPLTPDVVYEWVWELKYLKQVDATEERVMATLEVAWAQLAKYCGLVLFAGRDDVKFATLLFIGKEQYQLV